MRLVTQISILLSLSLCINYAHAQKSYAIPRDSLPGSEIRYIHSSIVGDDFEISILLPSNYQSTDTTYPVLYVTFGNFGFAMAAQIIGFLQAGEELPQILLVGIGYRSENISKLSELSWRDLTPISIPDSTNNRSRTGGSARFLRFVKEELMPFIKNNYRTSSDAGYFGYSIGGLFGLYTLFHEPETFHRYIIVSPSIWFGDRVTFKYEADYAAAHSDLSSRVFMSVGSLEEQPDTVPGMVTNMKQLADKMLGRHYPSLRLDTVVFERETHYSCPPAAISRGLRVIYNR